MNTQQTSVQGTPKPTTEQSAEKPEGTTSGQQLLEELSLTSPSARPEPEELDRLVAGSYPSNHEAIRKVM